MPGWDGTRREYIPVGLRSASMPHTVLSQPTIPASASHRAASGLFAPLTSFFVEKPRWEAFWGSECRSKLCEAWVRQACCEAFSRAAERPVGLAPEGAEPKLPWIVHGGF